MMSVFAWPQRLRPALAIAKEMMYKERRDFLCCGERREERERERERELDMLI